PAPRRGGREGESRHHRRRGEPRVRAPAQGAVRAARGRRRRGGDRRAGAHHRSGHRMVRGRCHRPPGPSTGEDARMKSFGDMVKQAQKMQKQMAELQEKLADARFEATAGGGLVRAVVDGRRMLKELTLSPEALKDADATMLEDLALTAVGEAQRAADAHMQETLGKLTGGMNLPF